MAQIEGKIIIDRSVESVFDFVSDERNEPLYNFEMLSAEKVTAGPVGQGTRFEALLRRGKREFPLTIEITVFERPLRLVTHSAMEGMSIDGELNFEPVGESTQMSWAWNVHPSGALRWFSPLVTWMGQRQEKRIWTSLKHHLATT